MAYQPKPKAEADNLFESLIINLDIIKTKSNNCFTDIERNKMEIFFFSSSVTASNTKRANLTCYP